MGYGQWNEAQKDDYLVAEKARVVALLKMLPDYSPRRADAS